MRLLLWKNRHRMSGFLSLLRCLTPSIQQIPTEHHRLPYSETLAPPVPVSAAAYLPSFVEQRIPGVAASDPASAAPVECHWKPVYHAKVGDQAACAWRKCSSYGGSARLTDSPATSRPVDCVAAEITETRERSRQAARSGPVIRRRCRHIFSFSSLHVDAPFTRT